MEFDQQPFAVEEIVDGVVTLSWPDGHKRGMSLRVARICHARVGRALAEYDAKQAKVLPIKAPRRGHAARS